MKQLDYQYPLNPDWQMPVTIDASGQLIFDKNELPGLDNMTLLLEFSYSAKSKQKMGSVTLSQPNYQVEGRAGEQYFEAGQSGKRYVNLSAFEHLDELTLKANDCRMGEQARLIGFHNPDVSQGPILIVAPHADDAELAAYGLYAKHHKNVWIVTLYAGETLQKLDKQYIPNLDTKLEEGIARKAAIRHWNSMTTPLLANVPAKQLVNLAYTGVTVDNLHLAPEVELPYGVSGLNPSHFRQWNGVSLANDDKGENSPQAMVNELAQLLDIIQPATVLVTDPEIDPHPEHRAAANALALAIKQSEHLPQQVLLYINHLKGIHDFPYGPEHVTTALAPNYQEFRQLQAVKVFSHQLPFSTQLNKVVALDSMHDLRAKDRFEKKLKRWWKEKRFGYGYRYYGAHAYFQTHIKAAEVFTVVSGKAFSEQLLAR